MSGTTNLKTWVVISFILSGMVSIAGGRNIYVNNDGSADFTTIQAAIDDSNDRDVVIIASTTYTGDGNRDIDFKGKAITVRSVDPNNPNIVAATIIDCQGTETEQHRAFYFQSGEDCNSIVSGLTIKNGNHRCGGGIYCVSSSPTIVNCVLRDNEAKYIEYVFSPPLLEDNRLRGSREGDVRIMCPPPNPQRRGNGAGLCCVDSNSIVINCGFINNSANEHGGGMFSMRGSPTVIDCIFNGNSAGGGGGMANLEGSCATLTNCTFTANTAETGGGGIRNADDSNPTLTNCMFSNNSAGWSGGLGNYYSSPTLTNCTFIGNSADNNGGGINNYESNPVFRNCIFNNNSAKVGGGIFSEHNSSSTLDNCTFSANTAENGGGIYCADSSPSIKNCTFTSNKAEYSASTQLASSQKKNIAIISSGGDIRIMCPPLPTSPAPAEGNGGGIYLISSSSSLTNCTFNANLAYELGGALYTDSCISLVLNNCTFSGNSAKSGGGMENNNSNPTFVNCTFTDNWAEYGGGGIRNAFCSAALTNCTFNDNSAGWSGGLGYYHCDSILTNCNFNGNTAETDGGGMNSSDSDIVQKNCIFSMNNALRGGAIFSGPNNISTHTNCTFGGNLASGEGGGIYIDAVPPSGGELELMSHDFGCTISNCIVWANHPEQIVNLIGGLTSVTYCDVQGGWAGEGNIDTDPCFVEPPYWQPPPPPPPIPLLPGSSSVRNIQNYIRIKGSYHQHPKLKFAGADMSFSNAAADGDYHLKSQAGRWNINSQSWVQDGQTSPCIDAGDPDSSLGAEPFPNGGLINMGAYGGTAEASKSYFGQPPCKIIVTGDINGDCNVDWLDFRFMVLNWLKDYNPKSPPPPPPPPP